MSTQSLLTTLGVEQVKRWIDLTPRASLRDAVDGLVEEHGLELLSLTEVELHVCCVDTEVPAQAIYEITGSMGGTWVLAISYAQRTSHLPVERCGECEGSGVRHWRDRDAPCYSCRGFGRIPVRVTARFDVQAEAPKGTSRRRDRANETPSPVDVPISQEKRDKIGALKAEIAGRREANSAAVTPSGNGSTVTGFERSSSETLPAAEVPVEERASKGWPDLLKHCGFDGDSTGAPEKPQSLRQGVAKR